MSTDRYQKAKNNNMNRQHQDVHPNIFPFSKKEILARNRIKTGIMYTNHGSIMIGNFVVMKKRGVH
jgi:hypothetical protein